RRLVDGGVVAGARACVRPDEPARRRSDRALGIGRRTQPMIAIRRAEERHHDRRREREVWLTFYPHDRPGPFALGFGALAILDEDRLSPGTGVPCRPDHDAEIVTYVRGGALAYDDAAGASGVLQAGEFQRTTARQGSRLGETN